MTTEETTIIPFRADFDSAPSRSLHARTGRVGREARNNHSNRMCKFGGGPVSLWLEIENFGLRDECSSLLELVDSFLPISPNLTLWHQKLPALKHHVHYSQLE